MKSDWKKDDNTAGEWVHTAGKWPGDPEDKGNFFTFVFLTCSISFY